jgi:Fuc2NAc and GlcNAc transferase
MGDVGSTFIGFVLALFVLYESASMHDALIWFILTSPFWFDATFTLLKRFRNGEKIVQAHRKHLFQRAVRSGLSHAKVTALLLVINIFILFLLLFFGENIWTVMLIVGLLYAGIVYWIEKRVAFDVA